jgi:three-Cys-motif partner protein
MPEKRYDWSNGPAEIQQHSIAKHNVLRSYLAQYFQTLISSPAQEEFRLTLVDGFAGGGLYAHKDTGIVVKGSPSIFLDASREAEYLLNKDRRNPIRFEIDYFFVDDDKSACAHLDKVLRNDGYGEQIGKRIHLRHGKFQHEAQGIVEFIKRKSPRNGRSIFSLDQYGYKDVPSELIRNIFQQLPSAEVILTFGVDSLLNFASDGTLTQTLLAELGLENLLGGRSIEDLKKSDKDWRLAIQACLYRSLVARCGAKHYTPFFVRNNRGHGDYWLIHLSQHHRARDVMTEVHWANNNYFIHYGGPGMDMFHMMGYDPDHDHAFKGQSSLGFEFDDIAERASVEALCAQIPKRVYANDEGVSFGELFVGSCNESPASARIYRMSLGELIEQKILEVVSADGRERRSGNAIQASDRILAPRQRKLFAPN